MGKLINRIPGSRLGFEHACCLSRQASRCQHAFSKPCLVNLISKDTHLVFSIYRLVRLLKICTISENSNDITQAVNTNGSNQTVPANLPFHSLQKKKKAGITMM